MDECSGDDNAGAKVFGDEEDPFWDPSTLVLVREDWEDSAYTFVSTRLGGSKKW